jgi:hypothetical protein
VKILGIRFCSVSAEAEALAAVLEALGLPRNESTEGAGNRAGTSAFPGAVFPAGSSAIEVWPVGPELPPGVLLQIIVDDAVAYAEHAKRNGLDPQGPVDAHGERIYFLQAPSGLPITFQSALGAPPRPEGESQDE